MLDQNTDHTWYMIGAVLVGAAILLLLNGTVPDLFAQVAGTYEEKTEEATASADEIGVNTGYEDRMLDQFTAFLNDPASWEQGGIESNGTETTNDFVMRTDYLPLDPGTYTLRATTERPYSVAMNMHTYREQNDSEDSYMGGTSETHDVHTFTVSEDVNHLRLRVIYHDPALVGPENSHGWPKGVWDPQVEVPLMDFEITKRTEK